MGISESYLIPVATVLAGLAFSLKTGAPAFLAGGLLLGVFFFIALSAYRP
ncbi:hypothetical protein [Neomoorella thermoacetica]|nr:hypothetical protein [Moorella thermoacetica]OIQ53410.1 hypothetical protein MORE_21380 [Moorella thermoacetica]